MLYTDDGRRTAEVLQARGVHFRRLPREDAGSVAAHCDDLYGNELIIVQRLDA